MTIRHDYVRCPNCEMTAYLIVEKKPMLHIIFGCNECGFCVQPTVTYIDLKQLNESRKEMNTREVMGLPTYAPLKPEDLPPRRIFEFDDISWSSANDKKSRDTYIKSFQG